MRPLFIANSKGISIGNDGFIRDGARLEVVDRAGLAPGRIVMGDRVNIEQGAHIVACDTVTIGNDVCITRGAVIVDTSHPVGSPGDGNRASQIDSGPAHVTIGDRVFIGVGCTILPNVTIGENSIIGAGSVVTSDIPANSIAVGSPARVVRTIPA